MVTLLHKVGIGNLVRWGPSVVSEIQKKKTPLFVLLFSHLLFNVCCHPIYSGRQTYTFRYIWSRGHTGGNATQEFLHRPSAVLALIFYREKDSAVPFSRRPWSRILCIHGISFSTCWAWCKRKSQFVWLHRDSNSLPNVRRFRGYQRYAWLESPVPILGRPVAACCHCCNPRKNNELQFHSATKSALARFWGGERE